MSGIIIASLFKLSKQEWYFSGIGARPFRSEKSGSSLEEVVNQRLVSLEYGLSMRLSKPVAPGGGIAGGKCMGEGKGGEQKRHGKKDRRHARRESERGAEEGENGFTRQSLSGRPRENHNARLSSSRRPSSSFCPPVRSSVCLPVHPFVSSSASCHSPRQPSDVSLPHQKFISSPVLLQVLLLFPPCRRSRRLVIMYCFIARTLLKFDPVTCSGKPRGVIAIERSAPPRDIR